MESWIWSLEVRPEKHAYWILLFSVYWPQTLSRDRHGDRLYLILCFLPGSSLLIRWSWISKTATCSWWRYLIRLFVGAHFLIVSKSCWSGLPNIRASLSTDGDDDQACFPLFLQWSLWPCLWRPDMSSADNSFHSSITLTVFTTISSDMEAAIFSLWISNLYQVLAAKTWTAVFISWDACFFFVFFIKANSHVDCK